MRIFGLDIRRAKRKVPDPVVGEGREARARPIWVSPYLTQIRSQVPLMADYRLYDVLEEAIPCLGTAISKIARLVGEPIPIANEPLKSKLDAFYRTVRVNQLQQGIASCQGIHVRQMLRYGKSAIEVIPNNARRDVYALQNIDPKTLILRATENPMKLEVCQLQAGSSEPVVLDSDWVIVSLFNPDKDPHGNSLFRNLPFVSEILLTMEAALRDTWERFGCPTYQVNWKPSENFVDPDLVQTTRYMDQLEASFTEVMEARKRGSIRDFFTSNVEVQVIGGGGQILEFSNPFRSIAEQIAGATHLPLWMLGFHWSTTERMSKQEADMLMSFLDSIRAELTPDWLRVTQLYMDLTGLRGDFDIGWDAISLQDAVEESRGRLMDVQALDKREQVARRLWDNGVIDQVRYAKMVLQEDFDGEIAEVLSEPASPLMTPASLATLSSGGRIKRVTYPTERPKDGRIDGAIQGFFRRCPNCDSGSQAGDMENNEASSTSIKIRRNGQGKRH